MLAHDVSANDPANLIGTLIAERYRVVETLGSGGMGAVVRAEHIGLGRDVALKVMHPSQAIEPDAQPRFAREARSVAALAHPNIVQVTDFGHTGDGLPYLVMELLVGQSLGAVVGEPLEVDRVTRIARQVLRGLAHAHDRGIVHRDLKPDNIFLTRDHDGDELVKIVDFGLAKAFGSDVNLPDNALTQAGIVVGTPRYMSPEQAVGLDADARSDLYALGVVMYEMLQGGAPFDDPDLVKVLRCHLHTPPPPLTDVPPKLAEVVMRLLAKERDERFASAQAVLEALDLCTTQTVAVPAMAVAGGSPTVRTPAMPSPRTVVSPLPAVAATEVAPRRSVDEPAVVERPATPRRPVDEPAVVGAPPRWVRPPLAVAGLLCSVMVGWIVWEPQQAWSKVDRLASQAADLAWQMTADVE